MSRRCGAIFATARPSFGIFRAENALRSFGHHSWEGCSAIRGPLQLSGWHELSLRSLTDIPKRNNTY
jgi:hypothetical protein